MASWSRCRRGDVVPVVAGVRGRRCRDVTTWHGAGTRGRRRRGDVAWYHQENQSEP